MDDDIDDFEDHEQLVKAAHIRQQASGKRIAK